MDSKMITPFLNATKNVLSTMTSTDPEAGEPVMTAHTKAFGVVTGIIGLAGEEATGNLLISFDQNSILAIVSRMLMEQYETLNNDVIDAVGEITNMICGGAKRELSENGIKCDMSSPLVITGQNVTVQQLHNAEMLSIPFRTPEGKFVLETNLAHKNGSIVKG